MLNIKKLILCVFVFSFTMMFSGVLAQDEKTTIDFWSGLTGPDGDFLARMVQTYNETNTDGIFINHTVYHWNEFFTRWLEAIDAGDAPDVILYHINEMPQYANLGAVIPMDDLIAEAGINMDDFGDTVREMSAWNGQIYGIPFDIHPLALYYNVDMVEAAGLDPNNPPKTGEEFMTWATALTTDTVFGVSIPTTNVMTFRLWWSLMFQNGGQFISDDLQTITINNPESAEALQFLYDLVHVQGVAPIEQADPDADFRDGKTAMTFQGPWWINGFAETENLNFMTAPLPLFFDTPAVWASSHFFSLSNGDDPTQTQASTLFVKWMVDNSDLWSLSGQIPASRVARESELFLSSDIYGYQKAFVDSLDSIVYTPPLIQSTSIFAEDSQTPLVFGWQAVMYDFVPVDVALEEMQTGIQAILEP